jgi:4-hydroxybenzoyl-CoA reductase subunit beta
VLPLPIFRYHRPVSLDEALGLLATLGPDAKLIAGGTDLLPNMKQGLVEPDHLVSLSRVEELRGIRVERPASGSEGERLVIGAGTHLHEVAESVVARRLAPALAEACGLVGGPHHRAMGTIGGNLCLDTRCRYYNQTYFWRKALGFCLKKDGTVCHVVKGGQRCVAAASNDSAPALLVLDATIRIVGPGGERRVSANDFFVADGIKNTVLDPAEIVVDISVPSARGRISGFDKLRRRGAIDFPLVNAAVRIDVDDARTFQSCDLVVSTLGARPRRVRAAAKIPAGRPIDELAEDLSQAAYAECKPLTNIDLESGWRREMVPVVVRRAVARALEHGSS